MVASPLPRPWSPAGMAGTVLGAALGTVGAAVEVGRRLPGWLAEAPRAVQTLPALAGELGTLPRRVAGVEAALTGLAPVLDAVLGRALELADDPEVVDRVDRMTTAVIELAAARDDLGRLAEAVGPLHDLAAARADIAALAGAVGTDGPVHRLAAAVADPTGDDGERPPRLASLDTNLAQAADQLTSVAPDLRAVAARIDALDRQIGVLADALAPLQGTTERIGRIVDRLPDRTRRLVTRPAEG